MKDVKVNTDNFRKTTRQVSVGPVLVGGGAPVSVQSMCTADTRRTEDVLEEIGRLERAGCEIVRLAVPDAEAAQALRPPNRPPVVAAFR